MGNQQETLFAGLLEQVKKQARNQGNLISRDEIKETFKSIPLSDEQLGMVEEYLGKYKINIGDSEEGERLSEEEMDYLAEYEEELSLLEQFSDGEKEAITLSAMAGEADAQQKLISVYLPRVLEISRLYAGQGVFLEDLVGEGNVALAGGVTMLGCLENAAEAEGMLMKLVMDAMEDSITEGLQEADKDQKILSRVNKVAEKAKEMAADMGRKVTAEELAEETGLSEKAILDAMRISGFAIEDIDH